MNAAWPTTEAPSALPTRLCVGLSNMKRSSDGRPSSGRTLKCSDADTWSAVGRFGWFDIQGKAVVRLHFPQRRTASQLQKKYLRRPPHILQSRARGGRPVAYYRRQSGQIPATTPRLPLRRITSHAPSTCICSTCAPTRIAPARIDVSHCSASGCGRPARSSVRDTPPAR